MAEVRNKKVGNKRNHRVVIIGDSCRGLAKEVQYHLNKNSEVTGFIKPGAGAEELVNSAISDIMNMNIMAMVESVGRTESCISPFINKVCDEQEVKCISCSELGLELLQARTEILSLEKSIGMAGWVC
jgi:hypothetical protein